MYYILQHTAMPLQCTAMHRSALPHVLVHATGGNNFLSLSRQKEHGHTTNSNQIVNRTKKSHNKQNCPTAITSQKICSAFMQCVSGVVGLQIMFEKKRKPDPAIELYFHHVTRWLSILEWKE